MATFVEVKRPSWLIPVSLGLSVLGLLVSAYLTYEHYTGNQSLVCVGGQGSTSSCLTVTTSQWSKILGLPVAIYGLLFFIAMVALCLPRVWRKPDPRIDTVRVSALAVGLLMVLWLISVELFKVHAICTWCTVVHILTFVLLAVVLFGQILSTWVEAPVARRRPRAKK